MQHHFLAMSFSSNLKFTVLHPELAGLNFVGNCKKKTSRRDGEVREREANITTANITTACLSPTQAL